MKEFYEIKTRNELAVFLDIPINRLTYILYKRKVDSYYSTFSIAKKNGESREINAPQGILKNIQKKIATELSQCYEMGPTKGDDGSSFRCNIVHGFRKKHCIMGNADAHKNKRYVLNIDLKDFFNSFHFGRVRGFFHKDNNFSFPIDVATIIAQLTCYQGVLPQGAPTSPIITNLICRIFDFRLLNLVKKYRLVYTRYADDMTFSTNDKNFFDCKDKFLESVRKEVQRAGFLVNKEKVRFQARGERQTVTGLVVNKKLNVSREYYKITRAMANSLYAHGEFYIDGRLGKLEEIEGRFSFINDVIRYVNKKDGQKHHSDTLAGREREYRKFLFYKYFYANTFPVIITEGKTDIRYLQAALKSLYKEYPSLIEKDKKENFNFKVYFLKRPSKRFQYFFDLQEGADSLTKMYYKFLNNKPPSQYIPTFSLFSTIFKTSYSNAPIILLYDNEINEKGKPLNKFIKEKDKCDFLKKNLYIPLMGKKVFLATNPLVNNKNSCAIEDLFPSTVLKHVMGGKTFSQTEEDSSKYYGKEIFSKYIYSHYEEIDFANFRPLLEALSIIIKQCCETENSI